MKYSVMKEIDIQKVIPLYIEYYNNQEDSIWTIETTYKRIHQVWSREDSYCLILEDNNTIIGFSMGYFEQYDDLKAYYLIEIIIDYKYQNKGYGKLFMLELENRVKDMGASIIQLQAVNDEMHNNFYGNLNYKNVGNLILKSKWL
ncbi:GNAT family N-acetyltransferase [uncultured Clostridium sp.]|uniref:GNAT family N-acetyltransferase n=1 Tax=uncultured Clostridium sp. TaxID=59620 RepID=UPI0025E4FC34|nr:GNAT family N-acetyltransferase [uncultured Clostridium sp.]